MVGKFLVLWFFGFQYSLAWSVVKFSRLKSSRLVFSLHLHMWVRYTSYEIFDIARKISLFNIKRKIHECLRIISLLNVLNLAQRCALWYVLLVWAEWEMLNQMSELWNVVDVDEHSVLLKTIFQQKSTCRFSPQLSNLLWECIFILFP